ncbi:MAG: HAD hydrolase-like protein [Candidatus Woesearchaeota archaeon]
MIKLVIFDAYGVTLEGGYPKTCKEISKKFNLNYEYVYNIVYKKYFNQAAERKITQNQAWNKAIKELEINISVKEIKKVHYSYIRINKKTVNFAKKLKINTLLLSKNTRSQFYETNKILGFQKYFKNIMNTWEYNLQKADKKTCLYIIKKFNIKPQEIIYTDDQKENLIEAKKLGINTILFKNFKQFKSEFDNIIRNKY